MLPPFRGADATTPLRSPYPTSLANFADRFIINTQRARIFVGYLKHRKGLLDIGMRGYQWLDGGFVEYKTDPSDIDVVTFYSPLKKELQIAQQNPHLFNHKSVKKVYETDAFFVPMTDDYECVRGIVYWYSIFSHKRGTLQ